MYLFNSVWYFLVLMATAILEK